MSHPNRQNALIPVVAAVDLTDKEGFGINSDGTLNDGTTPPFGVITDGAVQGECASVAVCSGGFAGTVCLKLGAPATAGEDVGTDANGAFDPAAATLSAQVLEDGDTDEIVEAVIFRSVTP